MELDVFDAAKWDVHFAERRRYDREKAQASTWLLVAYLKAMRRTNGSAFLQLKKVIELAEAD